MKPLIQVVAETVVGVAVAGVILAILIPYLLEAGYLSIGSPAGMWIIVGVIAACVMLAVFRPRRGPRNSMER